MVVRRTPRASQKRGYNAVSQLRNAPLAMVRMEFHFNTSQTSVY